jgi:hypothetical protein
LKPRRIRFTSTAQRHVRQEKAWWITNRIHTEVFATELEEALHVIQFLPAAGTDYPRVRIAGLRRMYVSKVACHLYYTFDDDQVIVRAMWGARRLRGPRLRG